MTRGGQNFDDLQGKIFFRLTVIYRIDDKEYFYRNKRYVKTRYLCQCQCGNTKETTRQNLLLGKTKSCGCYRKETSTKKAKEILIKYANPNGKIIKNYYHKLKKIPEEYNKHTQIILNT